MSVCALCMARSVLDRPTSLCAATSKHPETAATELSIETNVQNKKNAFASVRSPARANSSAMSYIKFLLCTLAVALLSPAAAIGLGSNFKDVNCTGSIQVVRNQQVIPINFWDIDQSASPFTFHDPEWLNAAMNSTTVPITDGAIEFGFGRIASKFPGTVHWATCADRKLLLSRSTLPCQNSSCPVQHLCVANSI